MNNCDCPVQRLDILPHIQGGTIISWVLRPDVLFDTEPTIRIEVSRHDTQDNTAWTLLGEYPISELSAIDTEQRTWGAAEQVYYRARLTPPNCYSTNYPSMIGTLPCAQRSLLREIIRRERLRHKNQEAQRGILLKRKYSGVPCPTCLDPDFPDSVVRSDCPTCYSTGWTGGYFRNLDFYTDVSKYSWGNRRGDFRPVEDNNNESMISFLNIPDVQPGDVWVEEQSDHRWLIDSVETLTRFGSYVVIAAAKVSRLPFNDIVYQFPKNL